MTGKAITEQTEYTTRADIATVRSILKRVKNYAFQHRYGGSWNNWEQSKNALEALGLLEKELLDRQMQLL